MLGKTEVKYTKLKTAMENDIMNRFPAISKHINAINIDKGHLSADVRGAGIGIGVTDSICTKEALPLGATPKKAIRYEEPSEGTKRYIDKAMDSFIKSGLTEEQAHKKVKDSLEPMMYYDTKAGQYVVTAKAPEAEAQKFGVTDSLLQQTSIPMWNIGWLTKIFKQPFATSHAKNLVSVESFNNPWADVIGMFKESFEGYGKLSNVARGNFKQNNSNPVTNEASQIVDEVFNLSVDYESDIMEDIKAKQAGNFVTGQIKADREKYAMMVLDRMQDALIYFGSDEAGIDGLADVTTPTAWSGTPLYDIFTSTTSTTRGSDIVRAMNKIIGDFLRANHYMAREVVINCSEYVFQALTLQSRFFRVTSRVVTSLTVVLFRLNILLYLIQCSILQLLVVSRIHLTLTLMTTCSSQFLRFRTLWENRIPSSSTLNCLRAMSFLQCGRDRVCSTQCTNVLVA